MRLVIGSRSIQATRNSRLISNLVNLLACGTSICIESIWISVTSPRPRVEDIRGLNVIVVEDVATSGGSLVDAAEVIRRAGGTVERAIVVVDREEGADEALRAVDIELLPLVRIGSLLQDE